MAQNGLPEAVNPIDPDVKLQPHLQPELLEKAVHPQKSTEDEDSAVTKAEKFERHAASEDSVEPPTKRVRLDSDNIKLDLGVRKSERQKGIAPIKAEFLVHPPGSKIDRSAAVTDDDAAEGATHVKQDDRDRGKKTKSRGQNTKRDFGSSREEVGLCQTRVKNPEFSPSECRFGAECKFEHDLRKYLKDWKRGDLSTFDGVCPIWTQKGKCDVGWKCRFAGSHSKEIVREDGRSELVLIEEQRDSSNKAENVASEEEVLNVIPTQTKVDLMKKKVKTPQADRYNAWLEKYGQNAKRDDRDEDPAKFEIEKQENRARYMEPPFLPSEKRKVYFGPETPILAPLTTQGNLPFRRLCIGFGAQVTYSEMAMSMPLLQGQKSEWALMRAHESEATPPVYQNASNSVVEGYDNSKDSKFGVQIAASKPWQALKATEVLTQLCPQLRVIDLNCGCPIDLVFRAGAGSGLLDRPGKLESILRGMNAVSGEVPITVKIRMGTKDNRPTATKLVDRLIHGGQGANEYDLGPCGAAAITLHGRSRQQRYTKNADWSYISECAALIRRYNENGAALVDTVREAEGRSQPASGKVYFIGNGDCYSHEDYDKHVNGAGVDSVMVARGALIKPWVFEEIEKGQYIDKSASERLSMVEQYVRYGLETWGSDEMGVGTTRRFLLEWLSFAHRYVPIGIMEHLPPSLQDRPPAWRGRNDLETLLGSDNYKDWIKISEMFLGPAHKDFNFQPKHKSNSYEIEAEG